MADADVEYVPMQAEEHLDFAKKEPNSVLGCKGFQIFLSGFIFVWHMMSLKTPIRSIKMEKKWSLDHGPKIQMY